MSEFEYARKRNNFKPPSKSGLHPSQIGSNKIGGNLNHREGVKPKTVDPIIDFSITVGTIASEIATLIVQKQMDYGSKNISNAPGGAMNGLIVRMHDKIARWTHLFSKKESPKNESIEDTLKDIAGYAIIALMVLRGLWDNEKDNSRS